MLKLGKESWVKLTNVIFKNLNHSVKKNERKCDLYFQLQKK